MNPDPDISRFLENAGLPADTPCELRRIGTDDAMVTAIIERIASGEKTMTYSLPWLAQRDGRDPPEPGRRIVVLDAAGQPALLLRLTDVTSLLFGQVSEADLKREGIPLRRMETWRPLHIAVWNEKLAPIGREVSDSMPVWAEAFDLEYPPAA